MKTKIGIEIHSNGNYNEKIVRMVTNHNEGKVVINLGTIKGMVFAEHAQWPTITPETDLKENIGEGTLDIIEKGVHTLTLTERTLTELAEDVVAENVLLQRYGEGINEYLRPTTPLTGTINY